MGDRRVRRAASAAMAAAVLLVINPAVGVATAPDETVASTATTQPVDTSPPTTPDTTVPVDTTAPGGLIGVDGTGSADATTITWIGIIAALVLIAVAAWWMLRRREHDDGPPHPNDDWPTTSEVI
ncbi:MAG: LPXTG cell wall anchor domain-containing protein [Ilumatobacter fluminis]|uniref:LPXTG cell wall anchor domain-containing protein n=1 Tax=Ilumatobacter fluminis TaxID=467091 RepID=UPI0032F07D75